MFLWRLTLAIAICSGVYTSEHPRCLKESISACIRPLIEELGVYITTMLDPVEVPPAKINQGCVSDTSDEVMECWDDVMVDCNDIAVTSMGEGYKDAMKFMCGAGKNAFEEQQRCLSTKKDHFVACWGCFISTLIVITVEPCAGADTKSNDECKPQAVDACLSSLGNKLGISMTTIYDMVAAAPEKIQEMCTSDMKTDILKCFDDLVFGCDFDEEIKIAADGDMAAIEYFCDKGKQDFFDNEACLRSKQLDFNECYEDFKLEIINTPKIKTCVNLDLQETCMTDAVKDCGASAVSWTSGFRRYVTRYLDRGHKCGKSNGYESGSRCTVEGLLSCLPPLSEAVGVESTSFLDLVQASPSKVKDMCMSDIKEDAMTCWENMIDGCEDNTIVAHGLAYIGAVEHMCGKHMEVFADNSKCLATKKLSFESCVGKFFLSLDITDRDAMCTKVESLESCMAGGVKECGDSAVAWTEEFYNSITKFIQNIFMCDTQCQQMVGTTAMDKCIQNLYVKAGLNSISPDAVLGLSEEELKFMCRDKYLAMSCAEGIRRNCKDNEKQGMMSKAYVSMLCDKDMRQNYACMSGKAADVQDCYKGLPEIFTLDGMGEEDVCSLADCVGGTVQECGTPATSWLFSVTAAGYGIKEEQLQKCSAISNLASLLTVSALFVLSKLFMN